MVVFKTCRPEKGRLYSWGENREGALGHGEEENKNYIKEKQVFKVPFTVKAFKGEVLDVFSNGRTTFTLLSNNSTIQSGVTLASETLTDFI